MSISLYVIKPSVTKEVVVLIPHYNNYKGLEVALQHIDEDIAIDILVVDDGSTLQKINHQGLKGLIPDHYGLSILELEINKGIEHALNTGLEYIRDKKYKYIARLDCNDLCKTDRFKKQIDFFNKNLDIALVGTQVQFMDIDKKPLFKIQLPTKNRDIRKKMYLNAMLIHPTIMMRATVLETVKAYPTDYPAAEDYAFYWEIMKHFRIANLDEILVQCLIDQKGISTLKRTEQLKSRLRLIKENFKWRFYPIIGLIKTYGTLYIPFNTLLKIKKFIYVR